MFRFLLLPTFLLQASLLGASRPNVIFILVDDWGWRDVGYNGSTFYETPEIDKLAQEWMRFDNCYTASPMCSPTRLSILTGKNPARHGVTQWLPGRDKAYLRKGEEPRVYCPPPISSGIKDKEITLGEALIEEGYETAFYGKWHMGQLKKTGGPKKHGYQSQKAIIESNRCSMFHPFRGANNFPGSKKGDNFTDLLTDAAIDFTSAQREKPFYLHLCYFAMHAPIESKSEFRAKFEEKRKSLPSLEKDRSLDSHSHQAQKLRQDNVEYAGELYNLDRNIGRLIAALKSSGQYENTIIILTGDNGGRTSYFQAHPTSNRPLRNGKTFLFEGGLRTPLLFHWPGLSKPGSRSDVPVTSMDFYPTILNMTGSSLKPDQHVDGISFAPLFDQKPIARDTLFWHFPHYQGEGAYPASAIRKGNHKLIYHYHQDDVLLYDLSTDPSETTDLSSQKTKLANQLKTELLSYLKETKAYLPKPKP